MLDARLTQAVRPVMVRGRFLERLCRNLDLRVQVASLLHGSRLEVSDPRVKYAKLREHMLKLASVHSKCAAEADYELEAAVFKAVREQVRGELRGAVRCGQLTLAEAMRGWGSEDLFTVEEKRCLRERSRLSGRTQTCQ